MYILDENNKVIDINLIPNQCDLYFWVYDNNSGFKDYYCQNLIMLESFYSPTVKLRLTVDNGRKNATQYLMNVPADYQLLIGEPTHHDLEVNSITSLSGRNFRAYSTNPRGSFRPEFLYVEVEDVLPSIRWYMPKMKVGQLLAVPLRENAKPPCVYITRDMPKNMEIVKLTDAQ